MNRIFIVVGLSLMLTSIHLFSQESDRSLIAKFLIEGGVEYGGDEILTVFFSSGGDQTMRAGQGGYLAIGGQFEFAQVRNLMFRTSIGIKYNTTAADNANIRLTRIPITVIPYLKIKEDFRLGVGITNHQNVKFKGDGFASDINFTSSIGPRFELGYKWIAISYTALMYKTEKEVEISASSLGASISYTFPSQ